MEKRSDGTPLKVLVEEEVPIAAKAALAFPSMSSLAQRIVEINSNQLQESLTRTIGGLLQASEGLILESPNFEVTELKIALALDASGEVSIVSLAKGALAAKTGIELTLKRKSG